MKDKKKMGLEVCELEIKEIAGNLSGRLNRLSLASSLLSSTQFRVICSLHLIEIEIT